MYCVHTSIISLSLLKCIALDISRCFYFRRAKVKSYTDHRGQSLGVGLREIQDIGVCLTRVTLPRLFIAVVAVVVLTFAYYRLIMDHDHHMVSLFSI